MVGSLASLALVLGLIVLAFWFVVPLGRGAVYVPSSPQKAALMADLCGAGPGSRAADLGSGDGRVVVALALRGAEAHGYEVNPLLVALSRARIRRAGLRGRAVIHWGSFWRADFSRFDALTVFQGSFIMRRLEAKVRKEMHPGSRVVSDYWSFPTLPAQCRSGTTWRYEIGSR